MRDLGTFGDANLVVTDLNDRDEIVGYASPSSPPSDRNARAFLQANGQFVDLAALPAGSSAARAIGAAGVVVGDLNHTATPASQRLFRYEAGRITTSTEYPPRIEDNGGRRVTLYAANERGEHVGTESFSAFEYLHTAEDPTRVILAEVYHAGSPEDPQLVNASVRLEIGAGDSLGILGFVIAGEGPCTVLVRAVGPTLARLGVSGVLADPTLVLFHGEQPIAANDNWGSASTTPFLARTMQQVGAFALPGGSRDAALVMQLEPGVYSAHATGVGGTTGVGLIELYVVPKLQVVGRDALRSPPSTRRRFPAQVRNSASAPVARALPGQRFALKSAAATTESRTCGLTLSPNGVPRRGSLRCTA